MIKSPVHADVAQLVEHHLAKVGVAGSNPVVRSRSEAVFEIHGLQAGNISGNAPQREPPRSSFIRIRRVLLWDSPNAGSETSSSARYSPPRDEQGKTPHVGGHVRRRRSVVFQRIINPSSDTGPHHAAPGVLSEIRYHRRGAREPDPASDRFSENGLHRRLRGPNAIHGDASKSGGCERRIGGLRAPYLVAPRKGRLGPLQPWVPGEVLRGNVDRAPPSACLRLNCEDPRILFPRWRVGAVSRKGIHGVTLRHAGCPVVLIHLVGPEQGQ